MLRVSTLFTLVVVATGMPACSAQPPPAAPANSTTAAPFEPAPAAGTMGLVADLTKDWEQQKATLVALAEAMPADKFGFKPTGPQRTYGEQIMHVAIGNVELMKLLGATAAA